jgi:hypothetical protein
LELPGQRALPQFCFLVFDRTLPRNKFEKPCPSDE